MMLDPQTAFAIYRLPNTDQIYLISGEAVAIDGAECSTFDQAGFIINPFNKNSKKSSYKIAGQEFKTSNTDINKLLSDLQLLPKPANIVSTDRSTYNTQIAQIKDAIAKGKIDKAILSRTQVIAHNKAQLADQFSALCDKYPNVMISLVHMPSLCTWLTATPEVLIDITDGKLTTVSLAGTQLDKGEPLNTVSWGDKELDEQQIVSDYITQLLAKHVSDKVDIIGPETISTGQVLHLKTTFTAQVDDKTDLTAFLSAMHPTPAVCGKPKQAAMQLINAVEKHDRAYYAGYLGPVDTNGSTKLFVNLRCMQLFDGEAVLYLGGGITAGSDAELEWRETEIKADTLLKVLNSNT